MMYDYSLSCSCWEKISTMIHVIERGGKPQLGRTRGGGGRVVQYYVADIRLSQLKCDLATFGGNKNRNWTDREDTRSRFEKNQKAFFSTTRCVILIITLY